MNDTLKTIASRYSCRNFSDKVISDAHLMAIAEAGNQAPTAMNRQLYHITMLKDKALIDEIENEGQQIMKAMPDQAMFNRIQSRGGKMFYGATAIAFIPTTSLDSSNVELIDLGIVAQNIALAATGLGIASCHCRMVTVCFSGSRAEEFSKKLQFPQGYKCGYAVLLGYAKQSGTPHSPNPDKISIIG